MNHLFRQARTPLHTGKDPSPDRHEPPFQTGMDPSPDRHEPPFSDRQGPLSRQT